MATGSPALGHLLRAGQTGGRGSNGAAGNEKAAGDSGEPHFGGLGQRVGLDWRRMQRTGAEPRDLVLLGRREREWTAELLSQTTIFEGEVEAIYISPSWYSWMDLMARSVEKPSAYRSTDIQEYVE